MREYFGLGEPQAALSLSKGGFQISEFGLRTEGFG